MKIISRWKYMFAGLFLFMCFSPICSQTSSTEIFYNVVQYGVVADGITKNTESIRKLINSVAEKGGGTLYFPAGNYLTGPIHLQSNITLHLEGGAVIKFSQDFNDYLPMVYSRWEGTEVINFSPQIYAHDAENITICGRGLLDGQGAVWWEYRNLYEKNPGLDEKNGVHTWQKEFIEKNKGTSSWNFWTEKKGDMPAPFLRPPMIQPVNCKNIRIDGISIQNPPFWTLNPVYCENVNINGITITNPSDSPNTDGINPDACRYVHISNCHLSVGDDCITIKSGRDADGRRVGQACENITITNCTMLNGHGGVVIGSEMSGDVRKITISNCVFEGTDRGIRLKTTRGRGGIVEDIRVSNIVMKGISREAITLNMFYSPSVEEPVSERTPCFRNIHFSDFIVSNSAMAGILLGLPEMPIENISFNQMVMDCTEGFYIKDARDIGFFNLKIKTGKGPAVRVENSNQIEFNAVKMIDQPPAIPILQFSNVQNVFIHDFWPTLSPGRIVTLAGKDNRDIFIEENNLASPAAQSTNELDAKRE